jgi:hypothetical protein
LGKRQEKGNVGRREGRHGNAGGTCAVEKAVRQNDQPLLFFGDEYRLLAMNGAALPVGLFELCYLRT